MLIVSIFRNYEAKRGEGMSRVKFEGSFRLRLRRGVRIRDFFPFEVRGGHFGLRENNFAWASSSNWVNYSSGFRFKGKVRRIGRGCSSGWEKTSKNLVN